jgi:dihydroflavonol-4-reductase
MYQANVEGTRAVLGAAAAAGCSRIVHTSTVGCIGWLTNPRSDADLADETTPVSERHMVNPYKRSKWQAEIIAREFAAGGAPVVIVNPTAPAGPGDARPTPTGKIIIDFMRGALPAYVDTGMNWVHVRDVAQGHIRAAERGRAGERYILGNAGGNWRFKHALEVLAKTTGRPAPRIRLPYSVAWLIGCASEVFARLSGGTPVAPLGAVRMASHRVFINPAKAIRELGLPQTPPEQALAEAVQWFRERGYVR